MKIGTMNHPNNKINSEIEWAGQNGFEVAEITYEPPCFKEANPSEIKDLLLNYNLEVIGHTDPNIPAIYPIDQIKKASIDYLKQAAIFFKKIGAKQMNIHPFYLAGKMSSEEKFNENIKLLKEISNFCNDLGMNLMLENYFTPFDLPKSFELILKEVPDLRIHLDIGHLNINSNLPVTLKDYIRKFGKKILHYHFHDNHGLTDEHLPLGCGNINWYQIVKIIKNSGYDGFITLEVFCHDRDYLLLSKEKLKKIWYEV